jgi:uncharacterized membrane protein YkvA (DUF1232 family)
VELSQGVAVVGRRIAAGGHGEWLLACSGRVSIEDRPLRMPFSARTCDPFDAAPPPNAERDQALVRDGFWEKFRVVAVRLPFAEDLLTAYYTATDPHTPQRVRTVMFAALAYFVMPADLIPDVVIALGFTDDAVVLAAALKTLAAHIRPRHRALARQALHGTLAGTAPDEPAAESIHEPLAG